MFGHISLVHLIYLHPPIFYQLICFCCISQQGSITSNKKHETTLIPVKQIHLKCVCVCVCVWERERERERERESERARERERDRETERQRRVWWFLSNKFHSQSIGYWRYWRTGFEWPDNFLLIPTFLVFLLYTFLLNFIRCSATYFRVFFCLI